MGLRTHRPLCSNFVGPEQGWMRVRLFLMRHSKSCSNHLREHDVELSQSIRDPGLTVVGRQMAAGYGPLLRQRLTDAGFVLETALIGSSALLRARETAQLLFEGALRTFPHLTEHGRVPENTPRRCSSHQSHMQPSWDRFIGWMRRELHDGEQLIAVGHGSYLRATFGGRRLGNLDGFIVDMEIGPRGYRILRRRRLDYPGAEKAKAEDRCIRPLDRAKIVAHTRKMRRRGTRQRTNRQRGAGYTTPSAFYYQGAQMVNTSASPTGVGVGGQTGDFIRSPVDMGRQSGGFTPSIMGALPSVGLRLIPATAYLAYRNFGSRRSRRSKHKSKRTRRSKRVAFRDA